MYYFGAYVNLVDGDIWDVEAAGSSPAAPRLHWLEYHIYYEYFC